MGAIHKMAATLGDSPTARALRGNFSALRSLPHLAKHFFLGFLFILRAKKHHTNENLFGSDTPSRHNADFCFHRAKWSEKDLGEPKRLASVGNLWRSSAVWRRCFGKTKVISMHGVRDTTIARVPVCFQPSGIFLFVSFDSRMMESWTSAAVPMSPYHCTQHMYCSELARSGWREVVATVTKANNHKHKTITAKTLGVETFSVGKAKEE